MDTKWLDDFLTVIDTGSFAAASVHRHASPSAITRRIQSLEEWAGATLIDRRSSPLKLTEAGEKFRPLALILCNTLEAARAVCVQADKLVCKPLAIAMPCGVADGAFPDLLGRWRAALGPLVPSMTLTTAEGAIEAVAAGQMELALVHQYDGLPLVFDDSELERTTVLHDEFALYAAAGPAGAYGRDAVGGDAEIALLSHGGAGYLGRLEGLLVRRKPESLRLRVSGCADTPAALKALVKQRLGAAFLLASTVRDEVDRGELVRLPVGLCVALPLLLVRRRRPHRLGASARLCDAVFAHHREGPSVHGGPAIRGAAASLSDAAFDAPRVALSKPPSARAQVAAARATGLDRRWIAGTAAPDECSAAR